MKKSITAACLLIAVGIIISIINVFESKNESGPNNEEVPVLQKQIESIGMNVKTLFIKESEEKMEAQLVGNRTVTQTIQLTELPYEPKLPCKLGILHPGDRKNAVFLLQLALQKAGYYPLEYTTYFYGSSTELAVYNFQAAMQIHPTGKLDEQTAQIINKKMEEYFPSECSTPLDQKMEILGNQTNRLRKTNDEIAKLTFEIKSGNQIQLKEIEMEATSKLRNVVLVDAEEGITVSTGTEKTNINGPTKINIRIEKTFQNVMPNYPRVFRIKGDSSLFTNSLKTHDPFLLTITKLAFEDENETAYLIQPDNLKVQLMYE